MSDDLQLCYPKNKQDHYGAYVVFQPLEVTPPSLESGGNTSIISKLSKLSDDVKKAITEIGETVEEKGALQAAMDKITNKTDLTREERLALAEAQRKAKAEKMNAIVNSGLSTKSTTILWKEAIKIYLPAAFTTTDTLTYDSPQLGVGAAFLESGLNSSNGSLGKLGFDSLKTQFSTLFADSTAASPELASLAASRLSNSVGRAFGLQNAVNSALRVTVDPNVRTLFKGVGIRNFQFQFKFIAESKEEAIEVEKIIKRFRKYAYPESISTLGTSIGFKFPNPFKITVKYRENAPVVQDPFTNYKDSDGQNILLDENGNRKFQTGQVAQPDPSNMVEDIDPVTGDPILEFKTFSEITAEYLDDNGDPIVTQEQYDTAQSDFEEETAAKFNDVRTTPFNSYFPATQTRGAVTVTYTTEKKVPSITYVDDPELEGKNIPIVGENLSDYQYARIDNVDGQQIGPKLKNCYLTNITTNYNPTSMSFHSDGKPVEIDMSLSFSEQTTLTRDDITNTETGGY